MVDQKITELTALTTADSSDVLPIVDVSEGTTKKITKANLEASMALGEVNTASNVGIGGVGVFKQKSGVDLQFRNINAGSSKVTVTSDTGNSEIDIDVAEANLTLDNLGGTLGAAKGGTGLTSLGTANQLLTVNNGATANIYKTLAGTTNQVTVTHGVSTITLSLPQDINTGAAVTFGSLALGTDLPISEGGTGASTASGARTNLELGALATLSTVGTSQIDNDAVTYAKIQNVTDARLLGRSAGSAGDCQEITVGSGLSLSGGTLTATGGAGLVDGDYGDITVSGSGTAMAIDNDVVTFAKMQNIATDRLLGRDTASSGDPEEITVGGGLEFTGTSGIQRSALTGDVTASAGSNSTSIASNAVVTAKIADVNVTLAKLANITTDRLLGRDTTGSGVPEELTVGGGIEFTGSGGIQTSEFTGDVTKTAGGTALSIAANAVTDADLRDSTGLSVIGRSANSTGDPADIVAGTDGHVLRRSGTTLGFGTLDDNSIADTADIKLNRLAVTFDGGGSAITANTKMYISSPWNGTIVRQRVLADQSGSIVIDVWKDTYANYPPTVADTITASAKPTISSATKTEDATLTGWTTTITAGDVLGFNVDSCTTITRAVLELWIRCS